MMRRSQRTRLLAPTHLQRRLQVAAVADHESDRLSPPVFADQALYEAS
jgi:hypothetical protein